ncbi:general stress protein [Vreelandella aquamarina]
MSREEAGQKGGEKTAKIHDKEFYEDIGQKGGEKSGGNFANDPERASEAGKKGGENSHSGGGNNR